MAKIHTNTRTTKDDHSNNHFIIFKRSFFWKSVGFVGVLILLAGSVAIIFNSDFNRKFFKTQCSTSTYNVSTEGEKSSSTYTETYDVSTYTVPFVTTQAVYPGNQKNEMLLEELPPDLQTRVDYDTIEVQNFTWAQLKDQVAFIVLVTSCEGVYKHLTLANDYVTVFFASAINDGLKDMPCHSSIKPGHHVIVNQEVGYRNNGLKVMAGYKAAKAAGFDILFKMDSDCVLNLPVLHKVLNFMASQPTKSYYVGEMMLNARFMSGMLYGISDYGKKLPIASPRLVPGEDVAFGTWMNAMHKSSKVNISRLNLAPWYYGKNKRELKYGCDWLVTHNSAWDIHVGWGYQDVDCIEFQFGGNFTGNLADFVYLHTRSDHRQNAVRTGLTQLTLQQNITKS